MRVSRPAANRTMPAIVHLDASELTPGRLGECFRAGAAAAVIRGNDWIYALWQSMISNDAEMPWQAPLFKLAENLMPHESLSEALGDVYFFKPGRHSYIGRKMEIRPEGPALSTTPALFHTQHGNWQMSEQLRTQCWGFSMAIMRALAPPGTQDSQLAGVRAVVQHLRYHDSLEGQNALYAMVHNSLGGWARIGYGLDRRREELRGPLGRRGVSDALALLSLLSPLRAVIDGLNRLAGRFDKRGMVPDGYSLLSKAHVDTRYFSALCGSRCNLRTDILVGDEWVPLPMSSSDVVIFPGMRAKQAYGIQATVHRVLQAKGQDAASPAAGATNTTILLGAK